MPLPESAVKAKSKKKTPPLRPWLALRGANHGLKLWDRGALP